MKLPPNEQTRVGREVGRQALWKKAEGTGMHEGAGTKWGFKKKGGCRKTTDQPVELESAG